MNNPAIVVVAYNRPAALQRLLRSIGNSLFPAGEIPLHIALDASDVDEVREIAEQFEWNYGSKTIQIADTRLGLKEHILRCGDLTTSYGSIILLEDDLLVSPVFYDFAKRSLDFYHADDRIAGVSLYAYEIAESCAYPFKALNDGSDVYFMQVASSWGQAWSAEQWCPFREWLNEFGDTKLDLLPEYIRQWGQHSWKKYFINYMIDQHRYFVFPQSAYSTNFEERGTNASTTDLYQVALETTQKDTKFVSFAESKSVYDAYFEMEAQALNGYTDTLKGYDYEVDLYGIKPLVDDSKSYVLTSRRGKLAERLFSSKMKPLVNNVIFGIPGKAIGLYAKENVDRERTNPAIFFPTDLLDKVNRQIHGVLSVSIVIPVLNFRTEELERTINSIPANTGNLECILVCDPQLKEELAQWAQINHVEVSIVSNSENNELSFVNSGLKLAQHEIQTWLRPGSTVKHNLFILLPKIFNTFQHINWISGVDGECDEKTYSSLNTAAYRWNETMAFRYAKRSSTVTMEGMFWRKSLYDKLDRSDGFHPSLLFYKFLREEKLYVVAYNFVKRGKTNGTSVMHIPLQPKGMDTPFLRRIISRLSYSFFSRNRSPWRLLFVEIEHLPDVLRYDFTNENFYLSRY